MLKPRFFCCFLWKNSAFKSFARTLWSSLKSKVPLFRRNTCNFFLHQKFFWFFYFWRTKKYPWTFPSIETPTAFYLLLCAKSISSTMQDILLQKRQSWKGKAKRVVGKGKRVVQSVDRGNMNFVFVRSCNSSHAFYHYVPALLRQHHEKRQVVYKLWNVKIRTPSTSNHIEWFNQT